MCDLERVAVRKHRALTAKELVKGRASSSQIFVPHRWLMRERGLILITSLLSQIGTPRELSLILLREPDECGEDPAIRIGCLRRFPSSEYSERPGSMAAAMLTAGA